MATKKVLSAEDANLSIPSIISSVDRANSDIDLLFQPKRNSGDIFKKKDIAAVKQSIKNILLTNRGERPFNYYFGTNIQSALFDLANSDIEQEIEMYVENAITSFEPRAEILNIQVTNVNNDMRVRVEFKIVNTQEEEIIETTISRLR